MKAGKSMESKDIVSSILGGIALVFTAFSIIQGLIEYKKQGVTKRAEIFIQMRTRLREDPVFKNICNLLETDEEELKEISIADKDRFLGFFEELAVMKNSGLINEQLTFYMFGYYAIRCFDSANFWHNLNRKHALWSLFMDFAKTMIVTEKGFVYKQKDFRL